MAYTNVQSGEIPEGTQYYSGKLPLGDYVFFLQFDATSNNPTVVARCDSPDGIRAASQRVLPEGTHILSWSVEANETAASVYITTSGPDFDYSSGLGIATYTYTHRRYGVITDNFNASTLTHAAIFYTPGSLTILFAANEPFTVHRSSTDYTTQDINSSGSSGVYSASHTVNPVNDSINSSVPVNYMAMPIGAAAAMVISNQSQLIARFLINLEDAGGYPGGSGNWDVPGDWNPDPSTTLHLTVNGALSGRHNDPLNDPSYSYVPADKETVKGYGSGGDGGNGGGGGAGASAIIVRQFATNKANSKDILALAKRHGYGSGGGKGGKGGDGCILIYY